MRIIKLTLEHSGKPVYFVADNICSFWEVDRRCGKLATAISVIGDQDDEYSMVSETPAEVAAMLTGPTAVDNASAYMEATDEA